jgi:hypothetical protein
MLKRVIFCVLLLALAAIAKADTTDNWYVKGTAGPIATKEGAREGDVGVTFKLTGLTRIYSDFNLWAEGSVWNIKTPEGEKLNDFSGRITWFTRDPAAVKKEGPALFLSFLGSYTYRPEPDEDQNNGDYAWDGGVGVLFHGFGGLLVSEFNAKRLDEDWLLYLGFGLMGSLKF